MPGRERSAHLGGFLRAPRVPAAPCSLLPFALLRTQSELAHPSSRKETGPFPRLPRDGDRRVSFLPLPTSATALATGTAPLPAGPGAGQGAGAAGRGDASDALDGAGRWLLVPSNAPSAGMSRAREERPRAKCSGQGTGSSRTFPEPPGPGRGRRAALRARGGGSPVPSPSFWRSADEDGRAEAPPGRRPEPDKRPGPSPSCSMPPGHDPFPGRRSRSPSVLRRGIPTVQAAELTPSFARTPPPHTPRLPPAGEGAIP